MRKGDTVRVTVGGAEGMEGIVNYIDDDNKVNVQLKGYSYPCAYHVAELEVVKSTVSYIVIACNLTLVRTFHGPFASVESAKAWANHQDVFDVYNVVPLQPID